MTDGCDGGHDGLFDIQKAGDGVWIAVATRQYKVNCNTVIVETDDGLLVVDSHSKPSAARVIVERLRDLTPKPVRYVVNTHFHWDHWQGNEVYPSAYGHVEVITNDLTREAMLRKSLKRIQDHIRQVPAEIAKLRADLASATDPGRRAELQSDLRQAEDYLAEVRALKPALPTIAFEHTLRLVRGDREIHLLHLGRAHTEGDVFVHLPKEKLVATGDAVVGWTPFMGDGYPDHWGATLRRLEALDFDRLLMGHGNPAGRDWLTFFRSYVEELVAAVRREVATGATLAETQERVRAQLGPTYEARLTKEGGTFRPWQTLVLANVERAYALVS
jgi:glyoxylase-like metal-dependent hydrolase (beta-lactamase superfamily II)